MIDINLPLYSNNQFKIGDEDLIKAINRSDDTGDVVTIDTSDTLSTETNFSQEDYRYNYLKSYFNSSIFEVINYE